MGKKYIPKHSMLWYQKLHRKYIDWEDKLYYNVTGIIKVYWNKLIICFYHFKDINDKFWDSVEEKFDNLIKK